MTWSSESKEKNKVLVQDEDIRDRWKQYFDDLFNGSHENVTSGTFVSKEDIKCGVCAED